jgi:hypothetical protein
MALQEHASHNVVSGGAVGEEFVDQVTEGRDLPRLAGSGVGAVPQMMVGIDDRQIGIASQAARGGKIRPNAVLVWAALIGVSPVVSVR